MECFQYDEVMNILGIHSLLYLFKKRKELKCSRRKLKRLKSPAWGWGCQAGGNGGGDNLMGMGWGQRQTGGDGVGMGMNFITVSFSSSFAIAGPATWNSLPASLRDDQLSVAAFRRLLKTELITRAYGHSFLARS